VTNASSNSTQGGKPIPTYYRHPLSESRILLHGWAFDWYFPSKSSSTEAELIDPAAHHRKSRYPARHKESVKTKGPLISVVDDDESIRESLPDLLKLFGFSAQTFSSAEEFLASDHIGKTKCLILDIAMPGMTGPDLQRELKVRQIEIPIIFMTAGRDDSVRPRLLKEGAVECLFKPFSDSDLLSALKTVLRVN
jgi:CheY-like chemotaxis protein